MNTVICDLGFRCSEVDVRRGGRSLKNGIFIQFTSITIEWSDLDSEHLNIDSWTLLRFHDAVIT